MMSIYVSILYDLIVYSYNYHAKYDMNMRDMYDMISHAITKNLVSLQRPVTADEDHRQCFSFRPRAVTASAVVGPIDPGYSPRSGSKAVHRSSQIACAKLPPDVGGGLPPKMERRCWQC